MEQEVNASGLKFTNMDIDALDTCWQDAKKRCAVSDDN